MQVHVEQRRQSSIMELNNRFRPPIKPEIESIQSPLLDRSRGAIEAHESRGEGGGHGVGGGLRWRSPQEGGVRGGFFWVSGGEGDWSDVGEEEEEEVDEEESEASRNMMRVLVGAPFALDWLWVCVCVCVCACAIMRYLCICVRGRERARSHVRNRVREQEKAPKMPACARAQARKPYKKSNSQE